MEFEMGTRVTVNHDGQRRAGRVVGLEGEHICVEFDEKPWTGHDGGETVNGKEGYCWWFMRGESGLKVEAVKSNREAKSFLKRR